MNDWDWDEDVPMGEEILPEYVCKHQWKKIVLIFSTVYNCSICDVKKEDVERD